MRTGDEIEEAIRKLSPDERVRLADSLPKLVHELDGDARWEAIIRDSLPRPKSEELLNEVDAAYRENPEQFVPMTESCRSC